MPASEIGPRPGGGLFHAFGAGAYDRLVSDSPSASWRTRDTTVRSETTPGCEANIVHTFLPEGPQ